MRYLHDIGISELLKKYLDTNLYCIKCYKTFGVVGGYVYGNVGLLPYDFSVDDGIFNAVFNIRHGGCEISDGEYKMRELLR